MITIENRPDLGRYQLLVDGEVAGYAAYERSGAHLMFMHTQIEDRFAGRGLGNSLMAGVLDEVRREGKLVLPYCPFMRSFIARCPEYTDLVPFDQRAGFELAGPSPRSEEGDA
ncbi:MAG TPA: GNAT family N-acetyltransferase [Solirubrobacteraceae bacterium]|nr:GNAT family N-acetyltransferase [Solirubrobacteraceae bacterium]